MQKTMLIIIQTQHLGGPKGGPSLLSQGNWPSLPPLPSKTVPNTLTCTQCEKGH